MAGKKCGACGQEIKTAPPARTPDIFIRGEAGTVIGMDLPLPETIADKLAAGLVRRVNPDGTPYVDEEVPAMARPANSAKKALWDAWAVHNGLDRDAAERATKQDLIDAYGEASAPAPSGQPAAVGRPSDDTDVSAWVAFAVQEGADRADAEAATLQELIELYGG